MSDVGSQVIVNGVPRGNMPARDYFAYKKQLIPEDHVRRMRVWRRSMTSS